MKNLISVKPVANVILVVLALLGTFHLLLILGIIPQNIAWGGQMSATPNNIIVMELIALVVLLFFTLIVSVKVGYVNFNYKFVNVGLWIMFAYFALNTLGNLASTVLLEKIIFTPITTVLAILSLRLALEKD